MSECFWLPIDDQHAARVPFPADLPLEQRAAYMAKPPKDAVARAELVRLPVPADQPAPPLSDHLAVPAAPAVSSPPAKE